MNVPVSAETNGSGITFRRHARVEYRPLANEGGVLLNLDTAAYHGLNDLGARIWELLDGVTLAEVVTRLRERLDEPSPTLADDAAEFLAHLADRGLVVQEVAGDRSTGRSDVS
jgi:Coenzyme PQQ synthesis protein D (PqqD)